jgi:hypothetical protein
MTVGVTFMSLSERTIRMLSFIPISSSTVIVVISYVTSSIIYVIIMVIVVDEQPDVASVSKNWKR